MMLFRVKTLDGSNGISTCSVDAPDETDARQQMTAAGRQVISISRGRQLMVGRRARVPLVHFSQELAALLDAGLSLVEALEALAEKESQPAVRRSLELILARLFEGRTLSAALAAQPASFPPLYVATVRASERSGAVREALLRYVAYQLQIDMLRKKLISACVYPVMLCAAGVLVTIFLLVYVVPRFSSVYEDLGGELPLASRLLMDWGRLLDQHGAAVALAAVVALALAAYAATRPALRRLLALELARIPAIGRHLRLYQLARLYRTVGMLLRGGIPAVSALEMSEGLLSAALRPALAGATQAVREGRSLAASLDLHRLTTPVAARMLRVGERTGSMGEMMERVAAFYDEELARTVDLLTRLIEPALMAVIGVVIGAIVVLMYFPIFELAGSLQ
jgi:general secretion pathway protein F